AVMADVPARGTVPWESVRAEHGPVFAGPRGSAPVSGGGGPGPGVPAVGSLRSVRADRPQAEPEQRDDSRGRHGTRLVGHRREHGPRAGRPRQSGPHGHSPAPTPAAALPHRWIAAEPRPQRGLKTATTK